LGYLAYIGVTVFNYGFVQAFAILQSRSDRDFYREQQSRIEHLEELGVHARRVHVRAGPGEKVSIGAGVEDGWPEEIQAQAWIRAESVDWIDDTGRCWVLEKDVSLYISGARGLRKQVGPNFELWDFSITSDQFFYLLITDEGPYKLPFYKFTGGVSHFYYQLAPKLEDFEREAIPFGLFPAWLMLLLTPISILAFSRFLPWDDASQFGLLTLYSALFVFVTLDGSIFQARWLRHRPREAGRRWRPEVRG